MTTNQASTAGAGVTAVLAKVWDTFRKPVGSALMGIGQRLSADSVPAFGADRRAATGDRFKSLASMIPGVVYQRIVSPNGDIRYTYLSEGAHQMFGVAPEEVLKDPEALFRTYSEDYKANFRQRLVSASEKLETWDVEASIIDAKGHTRYTHAIAKPERLPDGSTLWTGLILDATRIKQAEEELKAANRSVEAANRAKSMFLANMSHEIRTPMNGVLGMADLLLKTSLNSRQNRLLTTLRHSARTLLAIINDVLDISRIEAGRFELEKEPFDLPTCLEDAVDLCAGAAYQKGLELGLVIDGELPEFVKGDLGRLRQVLINLIGNAVKFTEKGFATLRVSATPQEDGRMLVVFKVIDTGIGIAPGAKETLFAPFSQADSSISRKFGGTGLGLAITRHLVTLMGGTVGLESTLGEGTTVTVSIPYEVADLPPARLRPPADIAGSRILIADNRDLVREALKSKLAMAGCEIDMAGDELETAALLKIAADQGRPYRFLLIDRVRPNGDNIAFARVIETDPTYAATRVIKIVSMTWKEGLTGEGTVRGSTILPKPVRCADLYEALCCAPPSEASAPAAVSTDMAAAASTGIPQPVATPVPPGLRVLLAEDNPVNQEVALEYLSACRCVVEIANNGEEAVELYAPGKFDIVLMDCQMPILDGLSAVRSIRELEKVSGLQRLPIIAVTANAYESDRLDAAAAGMDDYLVKPFTEDALIACLRRWAPHQVPNVA